MAQLNSTILDRVFLSASNDFQQRVTPPTQRDISQFIEDILAPMNNDLWNEFCNILVNRIGKQIINSKRWDNPLAAAFGKGNMLYGNTIQELAPKWMRAHAYQNDVETLLKVHKPDFAQIFHSVNRKDKYVFSFNQDEFRAAVADGADGYGINAMLDSLLTAQLNSADYDEYIIMKQLIAEYEAKWGFFNVQLSALPTDEATAKELLQDIRTYAGKFKFPSTLYNAGLYEDLPVFARDSSELVLMVTPDVLSVLDVQALSTVFHLQTADLSPVDYNVVVVDEFPIPDTAAILTTKDFYVAYDYVYSTASFFNPETLNTNYYLHVWQLLSVSPFVPCVRFSTAASTAVPTITETITAFDAVPYWLDGTAYNVFNDSVSFNTEVELRGKLTGTILDANNNPAPAAFEVAPKSFRVEYITGYGVFDDGQGGNNRMAIELTSEVYVDRNGILHIGANPFAVANTVEEFYAWANDMGLNDVYIEVGVECTYINPSSTSPAHIPDSNGYYPCVITLHFQP